MMAIANLLSSERVLHRPRVESKKRALEQLSQLFCSPDDIDAQHQLFEAFIERERLGSTGIGRGVAIPHVRSELAQEPLGALLHLKEGVDFAAVDKRPVDVIFGLVVPLTATDTHLQILAQLAKQFSQHKWLQQLRDQQDTQSLQAFLLTHHDIIS